MARNKITRRKFIGAASAASLAFTIVPRHVLGGAGFIPPSDKLAIAHIGCGTQGLREMPDLLANPKIKIVAVCDPNKISSDYIDWSPNGIRDGIRKSLNEPTWGEEYKGITAGRDVAQDYVQRFYQKDKTIKKYKGCPSYEDYRKLFEKEKDFDRLQFKV